MSTRCMIHFLEDGKPLAIIYKHSDGYPEGVGKMLQGFLKTLKKSVPDNRFSDPEYLAAKWVVFVADHTRREHHKIDKLLHKANKPKMPHLLDFTQVGVALSDHEDIEFRYLVHCDRLEGIYPLIEIEECHIQSTGPVEYGKTKKLSSIIGKI